MIVHVRRAVPPDAQEIVAMLREAADEARAVPMRPSEVPDADEESMQIAHAGHMGMIWLVAVDEEGSLVGFLTLRRGPGESGRHAAEVGVTVARAHRRRGGGSTLLRAAEDVAREEGIWKLCLAVLADNEDARRLYERLGYEVEGVRRGQWRMPHGLVDEVMMAKWLGAPS